ncbi:MAG TPA: NADH-quinone oxidoreductase subunit A [Coriobacteriia bacterium]|nr:MAG: NADH-quinone oxidoreductase subunit A [Actinobacteria bacterium 66_15]HAL30397.1 NADH-quinone oxidoreductase subunit A [Coriobacteriia bacterium]
MTGATGLDHLAVGAFLLFGVAFVVLVVWVSNLLSPKGADAPDRLEPYECGSEPVGPSWVQFRVGYYVYALLFVVFDIETVFLYPWAVAYGQLPLFILVEMVVFIAILAAGLAYAWKEGALRWR